MLKTIGCRQSLFDLTEKIVTLESFESFGNRAILAKVGTGNYAQLDTAPEVRFEF